MTPDEYGVDFRLFRVFLGQLWLRFTLVLKDPFGNSMIISQKAKKRRIGERELKGLKLGEEAIATMKR